jgi:hypothetical protein
MPPRRRIDPAQGLAALRVWAATNEADVVTTATAVRFSLEELAARAPGGSLEVRVPPYGATQCVDGPRHTRGTPPGVVEMSPDTWLTLVTGLATWEDAMDAGLVSASGERATLAFILPLVPFPEELS